MCHLCYCVSDTLGVTLQQLCHYRFEQMQAQLQAHVARGQAQDAIPSAAHAIESMPAAQRAAILAVMPDAQREDLLKAMGF